MAIEALQSSLVSGLGSSTTTKSAANTASSNDFTSLLGQMIEDTAQSVRASESTAVAGLKGQATTQQVVESVLTAERSLQTAIAVRDKAVSAYLELSRMSI